MALAAEGRRAGFGQGLIIVVTGFLPVMAIVALAPAVPSVMMHFAGMHNATTLVPLMVTAPGLMIALFSPAMGWAADRWGRRPVLLISTLIYGFLGCAPFFLNSLPAIFASRLGLGLMEAAILTGVNTLIGDYFDPARRRVWLTAQGIAGTVFGTSIIVLAGLLTKQVWNGAFLIYAVAIPIFLAMLVYIFEPKRGAAAHDIGEATGQPFPWKGVMTFSLVTLFSSVLYYVFIVQGGLALDAIGVKAPGTLGMYMSIASLGVPVGAIVFGLLSKRLTPAGLVAIYLACFALGMIGIGLSRTPQIMVACAMVQQVGAGMAIPSLILWATGSVSAEHRGRGMGAWSSAFFLGQFVSPLVVGALRGMTGGILPTFATMGAIAAVGAVVAAVVLLKNRSGVSAPAPRPV